MSADAPEAVEIAGEPTAVYRFYDANGALLYVGITGNLNARWAKHEAEKTWWPQVTRKTVVMYGSRTEAEDAEGIAIRSESPIHNVMGRAEPKRPVRKVPAAQPSFEARLKAARRALPQTFTLGKSFLDRIDAYADNSKCSRDAAVAVLLLTGIITYEQEAKLPPDERIAAMEARLQADAEKIPA